MVLMGTYPWKTLILILNKDSYLSKKCLQVKYTLAALKTSVSATVLSVSIRFTLYIIIWGVVQKVVLIL